jgi:hypothetical protein
MFHEQYEYRDPEDITVERVQYRRYLHEQRVKAIVSGFCWAAAGLVLMVALAAHVS